MKKLISCAIVLVLVFVMATPVMASTYGFNVQNAAATITSVSIGEADWVNDAGTVAHYTATISWDGEIPIDELSVLSQKLNVSSNITVSFEQAAYSTDLKSATIGFSVNLGNNAQSLTISAKVKNSTGAATILIPAKASVEKPGKGDHWSDGKFGQGKDKGKNNDPKTPAETGSTTAKTTTNTTTVYVPVSGI